jgi:hypothetical protein
MDLGSTLLAVLVIILDIVAIVSVVNGHSSNERKVLWTVVILLLPLIGMVLYFLFGRSAADA